MKALFDRLEQTPLGPSLLPGLAAAEWQTLMHDFPDFAGTQVFAELYAWRNGQPYPSAFLLEYTFYPLADSLAQYRQLRQVSQSLEAEVGFCSWVASWFPLWGFEDEFFLLDTATGQILFYFLEDTPRPVFDDLPQMLAVLAQAWETGVFATGPEQAERQFENLRLQVVSPAMDRGPLHAWPE